MTAALSNRPNAPLAAPQDFLAWADRGREIWERHKESQWELAVWWDTGERRWGEALQVAEDLGINPGYLHKSKYILQAARESEKFLPTGVVSTDLDFWKWQPLAHKALEPDEKATLAEQAIKSKMTSRVLEATVREYLKAKSLPEPEQPKFTNGLADGAEDDGLPLAPHGVTRENNEQTLSDVQPISARDGIQCLSQGEERSGFEVQGMQVPMEDRYPSWEALQAAIQRAMETTQSGQGTSTVGGVASNQVREAIENSLRDLWQSSYSRPSSSRICEGISTDRYVALPDSPSGSTRCGAMIGGDALAEEQPLRRSGEAEETRNASVVTVPTVSEGDGAVGTHKPQTINEYDNQRLLVMLSYECRHQIDLLRRYYKQPDMTAAQVIERAIGQLCTILKKRLERFE